jgi:hypothetical protein
MNNEHLDGKFERLYESLGEIRAELVAIKIDVNFHIHRTNLLEDQVSKLDRDTNKLKGFFSIGGWLVGACATTLTILNLLKII